MVVTMLSDDDLRALYTRAAETAMDDPGGVLAAGLRAVEAAVRADQIKKDAEIADGPHDSMGDLRANSVIDLPFIIAAAILAQLPKTGDNDE